MKLHFISKRSDYEKINNRKRTKAAKGVASGDTNKRVGDNYCNKRDTHVDGCNRQSQCRGELCEPAVPTSLTLENLPIEEYKKFSKLFDKDVYKFIDLENCVNRRTSLGGASPKNIDRQIKYLKGRE